MTTERVSLVCVTLEALVVTDKLFSAPVLVYILMEVAKCPTNSPLDQTPTPKYLEFAKVTFEPGCISELFLRSKRKWMQLVTP